MSDKNNAIGVAIAGLGTVGVGVIRIIEKHTAMLEQRSGRTVEIVAVSARDRNRDRGVDLSSYAWVDDTTSLADHDGVDVVIELVGGSDGTALALARNTLKKGKAFVTANKALIAIHGKELAKLAEEHDSFLAFEAAVAGGIPILKALKEGLAGNQMSNLRGILNGTCNYILTRMENEGLGFEEVLADAQRLGYAEADPTFDVDGIDTAHKTAILAALAFGVEPDFAAIECEGIRAIASVDIDYARTLGYTIKLLGSVRRTETGIEQHVHPAMVPLETALANVSGATNAVQVYGDAVGETVYIGAGAGELPTASAVMADVVDYASGNNRPAFGVPSNELKKLIPVSSDEHVGSYYIRFRVIDELGKMAEITSVLRDSNVSIESMIQLGSAEDGGVYMVLTTHPIQGSAVHTAIEKLHAINEMKILDKPVVLRIAKV
ncbi:homoserine dehydrogenase [Temperatibacter marinus]|uniref:Homoserine dehydrogenase n=1 Tax=Temperatibacter marinus TaxID=1456591 RepID=A0AA52H9T3_9PROT|nr:homoserine dehydrogenase [Temperatibacter marinus]WND01928.1 homoserine dehydrogenase [Temperatibacter marinus]